jgi:phage terminase small subunit
MCKAMPVLRNPRHERFAQLLASGKTAKDAYATAGYKPSESNGAWLARKEEISSRVAEINNETLARERATAAAAAERAVITRQSLIEKAEAIYAKAIEAGQLSAAVAATKEIGVLAGIRIERSERGMPGEFDWVDKLSVDELRLLADGKLDIASFRKDEDVSGRSRPN